MKQQILCPTCKCLLSYDPSMHWDAGVCPVCTSLVPLQDLANAAPERSSAIIEQPQRPLKELWSLADYSASLQDECRELAARHHIDVNESFYKNLHRSALLKQYRQARTALPQVPAYRPRTPLTAGAVAWLLLGVPIAIPAALAMELLAGCLVAGVFALVAHIMQNSTGRGAVFVGIAGFLSFFAPFIAGGWVCAWVITRLGRQRKIRQRWIAAFLAAVAAGTTVLILWAVHSKFGREPFRAWDPLRLGANLDVFSQLFFGTNFVIALVGAARFAAGIIQRERFCEECREFMKPVLAQNLCAGGIKAMVYALAGGSVPLAASLLKSEGDDGTVSLSRCPACGDGIVDVTVSMEPVNKTWCVAFMNLRKHEVDWFVASQK